MIGDKLTALKQKQVELLSNARNRAIISKLEETNGPIYVVDLAEQLVEREIDVVSTEEYELQLERMVLALHHDQLPKLAEADLIEYNHETNTVERCATPRLGVEWLDEITKALKTQLEPHEADDQSIGVINGSDSIVEYGRQLCDEATEELFCMYISAELLADECVRRVKAANQRDVHVYMGSEDACVRDATRKHCPDATIWEPQLDWMNTPTYPRVARLILADRKKVMLAIIDDADGNEPEPVETALVGNGESNPLVVLVRELLGQRLDHLDFQHKNASAKSLTEL